MFWVGQGSFLIISAATLGAVTGIIPICGFLSSHVAVKAIQDGNFGKFLPVVKAADIPDLCRQPDVNIIDARLPDDFMAGRIGNAINVSVRLSDKEVAKTVADIPKGNRIIIYPHSNGCAYAEFTAKRLHDLGFRRLILFEDGWTGWIEFQQSLGQDKDNRSNRGTYR